MKNDLSLSKALLARLRSCLSATTCLKKCHRAAIDPVSARYSFQENTPRGPANKRKEAKTPTLAAIVYIFCLINISLSLSD